MAPRRFERDASLPPLGQAAALALGVLKTAKVRRWADLGGELPESIELDADQRNLLVEFGAEISYLRNKVGEEAAVTIVLCSHCQRWSLASGTTATRCQLTTDCPGAQIKVVPARAHA